MEDLAVVCRTMLNNSEFTEAQDLITQAERVLLNSYDELLRKAQIMGYTSFYDHLKADVNFWQRCYGEWGRGPGYKQRVVDHNRAWFAGEQGQKLKSALIALIQKEWNQALIRLKSLFEAES